MELLLAHGRNPFTGGPIREMDSPGNYFRRTREDGEQVLVAVTSAGAELELELAQVMKSIEQEIRWAERGKRRR
jgi:hypothetical protein